MTILISQIPIDVASNISPVLAGPIMASSTVENYLKHILLLSEGGDGLVSMGALAESLAVVPGTVTTMVKALADGGFARHHPRQGVKLTDAGRRVALNVLRKHRLV